MPFSWPHLRPCESESWGTGRSMAQIQMFETPQVIGMDLQGQWSRCWNDSHSLNKEGSPESLSNEIIQKMRFRDELCPAKQLSGQTALLLCLVSIFTQSQNPRTLGFLPHFAPVSWNVLPFFIAVYHSTGMFIMQVPFSHLCSSNKAWGTPVQRAPKWVKTQTQILGVFIVWPVHHPSLFKVSFWTCLGQPWA